jgi:hypothetical protein
MRSVGKRSLIAAGLLSAIVALTAMPSAAQERERTPSDYFVEQWLMGTLGGFITGPIMERVAILIYCGPEDERPSEEKVICQGFGTLIFRTIFYVVGIPVGVSAGVLLDGWIHGIAGNVWAAITVSALNSVSWMTWAFVLNQGADYLAQQPGLEPLQPWVEPFKALVTVFWPTMMTSFMTTAAYHIGAKFKDERAAATARASRWSLRWSVPLFRLTW